MGAGAWCWLLAALARGMPAAAPGLSWGDLAWLAAALVVPACAWYALILWRGLPQALGLGFVVGVLPLMAAVLSPLVSSSPGPWLTWLPGISGLTLPAHAVMCLLWATTWPGREPVFFTSLTLHAAAAVGIYVLARKKMRVGNRSEPVRS